MPAGPRHPGAPRRAPALCRAAALLALAGVARNAAADEPEIDEPEIEVLASGDTPVDERADPTPHAYVVRGAALASPGSGTVEALSRVPGADVSRTGGPADLATVSLRGSSSAQTPIYLGGVRLNDEISGTTDLSTLPLWMLDRIEVYRGHAPLSADELGMGGAVFLEPRWPRRTEALGALGLGSFGEKEARAAAGIGGGAPGDGGGALFGMRLHAGDGDFRFVDDGGTRFDESDDVARTRRNADHRELDAWALGRIDRGDAHLFGFANVYVRDAGAPGLSLLGTERTRSRVARSLAGIAGETPCGGDGRCVVQVALGALVTRYRLRDPLRELGAARDSSTEGERFSERIRLTTEAAEWIDVTFGAMLSQQLLRLSLDHAPSQRARRHLLRVEASALAEPHDDVAVSAGGAFECHSTAARGIDGAGDETCGVLAPVGRVGARWRALPWLSVSGNLGRYQRVPSLGELYGVSAVVRGNPELVAEGGYSLDAGAAVQGQAGIAEGYAQLVGFARWADDLIGFRRSALGQVRPYNVQSARVLGAELAGGVGLWRVVGVDGVLTLLDPRDVSDDRQVDNDLLPLHARLVAGGELWLVSPRWPTIALDRARLASRIRYRASRVADPAGLIRLDDQIELDLEASLAFFEALALSGRVANLLDRQRFDVVGHPLPGRSWHALVEAWW